MRPSKFQKKCFIHKDRAIIKVSPRAISMTIKDFSQRQHLFASAAQQFYCSIYAQEKFTGIAAPVARKCQFLRKL
jgi:hypothetical protein